MWDSENRVVGDSMNDESIELCQFHSPSDPFEWEGSPKGSKELLSLCLFNSGSGGKEPVKVLLVCGDVSKDDFFEEPC